MTSLYMYSKYLYPYTSPNMYSEYLYSEMIRNKNRNCGVAPILRDCRPLCVGHDVVSLPTVLLCELCGSPVYTMCPMMHFHVVIFCQV